MQPARASAGGQPLLTDPGAFEIIVVMDAWHDGSLELVEELAGRHPVLRPLMLPESVGTARARMAGARSASGDVILSLDYDVIARPGWSAGISATTLVRRAGRVVVGYMPTPLPRPRRPGRIGLIESAASYEAHCRAYERDPRPILTHFWGSGETRVEIKAGWTSAPATTAWKRAALASADLHARRVRGLAPTARVGRPALPRRPPSHQQRSRAKAACSPHAIRNAGRRRTPPGAL